MGVCAPAAQESGAGVVVHFHQRYNRRRRRFAFWEVTMLWAGMIFMAALGVLLIVWRKDIAGIQAAAFGARMHHGCVVAEGILIIVLVVIFGLLYLAGIIPFQSVPGAP